MWWKFIGLSAGTHASAASSAALRVSVTKVWRSTFLSFCRSFNEIFEKKIFWKQQTEEHSEEYAAIIVNIPSRFSDIVWRKWNTGSVSTEHSRAVDTSAPTVTNRKANYFQAATGFDDALLLHDEEMRQILNRSSTRCQSTTVQMPRIYSLSFSALLHLIRSRTWCFVDRQPCPLLLPTQRMGFITCAAARCMTSPVCECVCISMSTIARSGTD